MYTDKYLQKLILSIGKYDKNALQELYELTKNDVFAYSLSITKNISDSEDVLQDVYIKIYNSANGYIEIGNPLSWILKIARNECLMKIRKNKRVAIVEDDFFDNIVSDELSALEHITLKTAFNILKRDEMEIIVLYIYKGFKHKEIADIMNIPLSTVLSKYQRSLKKLKNELMKGDKDDK